MKNSTEEINPFNSVLYDDSAEKELISKAIKGNKEALEQLIIRHQDYIFNVALKTVSHTEDAEDITQEILIKVITNLSSYNPEKGRFRTWLYRITFNHILNLKKQKNEKLITGFDFFFDFIKNTPEILISENEEKEYQLAIEESKVSCMSGMIMCLDREQRVIYVIGEVFEIDHNLASEIFNITPENFRKKLSRARSDLYQWMNDRCGLVNPDNPCRCPKKTKGFIQKGVVDPVNRKWLSDYKHQIHEISTNQANNVLNARDRLYSELFKQHPFKQSKKGSEILNKILNDKNISGPLNLNE